MTKICRLTCHIRTGNDIKVIRRSINVEVIGDETIKIGLAFNHRMAAAADIYPSRVIHRRASVAVFNAGDGKRNEYIDRCNDNSILLNVSHSTANFVANLIEDTLFNRVNAVLRSENLRLIFAKCRCRIAVSADEILPQNVDIRIEILRLCLRYFDIVTPKFVVFHFQ